MAKYTVIHPSKAVIFKDGTFKRQGEEVDLTNTPKKRIQRYIEAGIIAAVDSTEAKSAVKAAKAAEEEAE